MYNFLDHLFLDTGFPIHACLIGAIVILLSIYWEDLTK